MKSLIALVFLFAAVSALKHCKPVEECLLSCEFGFALKEDGCPGCACQAEDDMTMCQMKAHKAKQSHMMGTYVPSCLQDGSYAPKQCWEGRCVCVDEKGKAFTKWTAPGASSADISCDCMRDMKDQTSGHHALIGMFVPKCQSNGRYETVQCWASTGSCWCVNETDGTKLTEAIRGKPDCTAPTKQ